MAFAGELDSLLASEALDRSQSLVIAETKVKRLEMHYHCNTNNPLLPAYQEAKRENMEIS